VWGYHSGAELRFNSSEASSRVDKFLLVDMREKIPEDLSIQTLRFTFT